MHLKSKANKPPKKVAWQSKFGIGKERDTFLENLSLLVVGMTLTAAVKASSEEAETKKMRKIGEAISDDIDAGKPLWQAFQATGIFSDYTISLVRIGEESGTLPENLKAVALHQSKDRLFKSQLRSAMAYPVLVLCLTVVLSIGVAVFILPKLADVFSQLKVELPLPTKILIGAGEFFQSRGIIVIPIFLAAILAAVYVLFFNKRTRHIGHAIGFKTPIFGRLMREVEMARFGYLLGSMLQTGLPITQALESFKSATPYPRYSKFYAHLQQSVEDGMTLRESFVSYKGSAKLVPKSIQQLVFASEQSGSLSEALLKVGSSYENKIETTTKNLTTMLEPILLILVWVGVVGVALGVILPIYNLIGNLNS